MSYRLELTDPDIASALRRVATEQLDDALEALSGAEGEKVHESVHEARKNVKKLRGALRLVRGAFPGYSAENSYLRDAARLVSDLRDKQAMLESYDRVLSAAPDVDGRKVLPLRRALESERDSALDAPEAADRLVAFRTGLETVREAVPDWSLKTDGWPALEEGLKKTYGRGRGAMDEARQETTPATLHEWRKRVKYHWYHARLLREAWPKAMKPHIKAADHLSDLLGDRHDIDVLKPRVSAAEIDETAKVALLAAMAAERERLDAEAFALGRVLYADKPKALARRWGTWWSDAVLRAQA
ncbi:CHAD domain-containing protein [Histidinibacterium aquaticum]|uniref:CHAD domain-containing protein n=1 Tax=Histidinibacterium aquaticum TaxID=2613962 RepID=A0A5J5GJ90_9RHOB|nr:CHAD domain-containing protein [Histidinibacterium aquaticum]KAA9008187.1 CHAD domain-containing protein [Histidinibacterium aquaticum]